MAAGRRLQRGEAERYGEQKTERIDLILTPTGKRLLDERIAEYRDEEGQPLSRNEYFERFARGLL